MGMYPAWQSSRADLVDGLKDGGRAMTGSRGQSVSAVAWSRRRWDFPWFCSPARRCSSRVSSGSASSHWFQARRLWVGGIGLPPAQYPDPEARARFVDRLLAELKKTPGIEVSAVSDGVPLNGSNSRSPYARVDGNPPPVKSASAWPDPQHLARLPENILHPAAGRPRLRRARRRRTNRWWYR